MTREEASEVITIIRGEVHPAVQKEWEQMAADVCIEALDLAIAALKGPTREQVEKMRGEWIIEDAGDGDRRKKCSLCDQPISGGWGRDRFCANWGAPMTYEAVDVMMKRLEEVLNADTGSV